MSSRHTIFSAHFYKFESGEIQKMASGDAFWDNYTLISTVVEVLMLVKMLIILPRISIQSC